MVKANSFAEIARNICAIQGLDYDEVISREETPWWEEPGDYRDADGILHAPDGRIKEHRYDNGTTFPILTYSEAAENATTPERRAERIADNRARCFADALGEYAGCTFANLAEDTDENTYKACAAYVRTFEDKRRAGMGLIMHGKYGRGKTHMAACICNALIDEGYKCRMTSVRHLVNVGEEKWGSWANMLRELRRFDLVVLDDIGTERGSGYMDERVFDIVDNLYSYHVPVIVTTNLSADSIAHPTGASMTRVMDRLKERCQTVEVEGPNRRQMHA
jgi:DNA replication protein DnaC